MPYKPSLLTALCSDYEDAARKYMDMRNLNAEDAEHMLRRMKVIGKNIEYTHRMIDGTIGKPLPEVWQRGQAMAGSM